jgi:hypothetical protein
MTPAAPVMYSTPPILPHSRSQMVTVSDMNYGRSPDGDRWHRLTGGKALCGRGRGGGTISGGWALLDRLPPRHEHHCAICFPGHVTPPGASAAVAPRWDLDQFLDGL